MSRIPALGPRGEGWVALQGLLLIAVIAAGLLAGDAWSGSAELVTRVVGLALLAVGVVLAGRGLRDLGGALTPLPRPRHDAELVERGIYGYVRHPVYGGLIVCAFGFALLTASLLGLLVACVVAVFFSLKSRREEVWLVLHFSGYAAYRQRTRRFIPWLY